MVVNFTIVLIQAIKSVSMNHPLRVLLNSGVMARPRSSLLSTFKADKKPKKKIDEKIIKKMISYTVPSY